MTSPDGTTPPPQPTAAPAPPPPAAAAPPPAAPNALNSLVATMGLAQLLVVGGSALLVAVDLVFGLFMREYSLSHAIWGGAALTLLAYLANRRGVALPFRYESVLLALGAVVAVVGLREIAGAAMSILRAPGAWDGPDLLAFLGYAVGVVAVGWGTWQLLRGRR